MKSEIIECVLEIARAELGVREEGTNRGPRVAEYLKSTGMAPGNPWCAAFVCWCLARASERLGIAIPVPRTAYCPTLAAWAQRKGVLHDRPEVGDLFLRWGLAGRAWRFKHTGFVVAVEGDRYTTVEGNTKPTGDRGPDRVVTLRRALRKEDRFVRWIESV